jgi:fatty-acyl-CoA synthase
MPFYHGHAVGFGMMTCLLSSGHLVMTDRMDPFAWARVIATEAVTVTSMVPSMLQVLVRTRVTQATVPTLRWVFVSAAPLPSQLARQFEEQSGLRLAHAWGLSEFTNFATVLPADAAGPVCSVSGVPALHRGDEA